MNNDLTYLMQLLYYYLYELITSLLEGNLEVVLEFYYIFISIVLVFIFIDRDRRDIMQLIGYYERIL